MDPAGEDSAWRGLRPLFEANGFTVANAEPLSAGGPQALRMERSL